MLFSLKKLIDITAPSINEIISKTFVKELFDLKLQLDCDEINVFC